MRPAVVSEMRLPKTFEQVRPQLLLQLPHLRADSRLRAVTRLRRLGETLQPDDL